MSCAANPEFREREGAKCCTYCGSLSVADAIRFLKTPGAQFSGSDWKYGWPHKFYIEVPNPNASELVDVGGESGPHVDGTHKDDRWVCFAHHNKACTCPKERATGYWDRVKWGHRERLHFKFYNTHLANATDAEFKEFAELSEKIFGIHWERDADLRVKWRAPRTTTFGGYQRYGTIAEDGSPKHEDGQ